MFSSLRENIFQAEDSRFFHFNAIAIKADYNKMGKGARCTAQDGDFPHGSRKNFSLSRENYEDMQCFAKPGL